MVYPWMNDVNDGSLAMDEGTTEKVSDFLPSETLCEREPSQGTLLHQSPCSSVVRAPDRRQRGHGFDCYISGTLTSLK